MVVVYHRLHLQATEWRIAIRRQMNETDTEANTKAIDTLLNYETVKYFGNEEHEAARYDRLDGALRDAPRSRPRPRCRVLNIGQAAIIAIGLTVVMVLAARGRHRRHA